MRDYVFLSYRRSDSAGLVGRIRDRLEAAFGPGAAFMDVEDIQGAEEFAPKLFRRIQGAAATLVLIGPGWLNAAHEGRRRLDDPNDYARREIETALASQSAILPVLLDGAPLPASADLPASLSGLLKYNALEVRSGASFGDDVARLIASLRRIAPDLAEASHSAPKRRSAVPALIGLGAAALGLAGFAWMQMSRPAPTPADVVAAAPATEAAAQPLPRVENEAPSPAPETATVPAPSPPAADPAPTPVAVTAEPAISFSNLRLVSRQTYKDGHVIASLTFDLRIENLSAREIFVIPMVRSPAAAVVLQSGAELSSVYSSAKLGVPTCHHSDPSRCGPQDQTAIGPGQSLDTSGQFSGRLAPAQYLDAAALRSGTVTARFFVTDRAALNKVITFSQSGVPVEASGFAP